MKNSAIILLSGGLDSVVSLAIIRQKFDNILAITFNYGQQSFNMEYSASKKIADYYHIGHELITLEWLKKISKSALTSEGSVPDIKIEDLNNKNLTTESAKSVWVPNRNALFVNIAACYCEALCYNNIVIGANKEESLTFKDNSVQFIDSMNEALKNSVNSKVELIAPLINMNKEQIVKKGIELEIPFEYIYSCYKNSDKNCGECESCSRLKRALELNGKYDVIERIF